MNQKQSLLLFFLFLVSVASGGGLIFPEEFQSIRKIRSHAEAEKRFLQLAEQTSRQIQKDEAYFAAADRAVKSRDYASAEKHLALIRDAGLQTLGRMKMMFARRQFREILGLTSSLPLENWREDLIPDAAYLRAYCNGWTGNKAASEKDCALALAATGSPSAKYTMIYQVANIYQELLKIPDKELALLKTADAYEKHSSPHYIHRIKCRHAWLLGKTGQVDEGLRYLQSYRGDRAPSRRFRILETLGDLQAMKGDKAAARKSYQEAASVYAPWKSAMEKKIARLGE